MKKLFPPILLFLSFQVEACILQVIGSENQRINSYIFGSHVILNQIDEGVLEEAREKLSRNISADIRSMAIAIGDPSCEVSEKEAEIFWAHVVRIAVLDEIHPNDHWREDSTLQSVFSQSKEIEPAKTDALRERLEQ
ncbi:hypothetical protein [Microbulbifer yueqingensis]|uniref:hypothetical protein n=1 Tax=Microbulbifer yueqingensis TaxID=658219 RepID=UPI00111467F4|nr:hypothetical protein [Microbulbifer yueqingensis]